MPGQLVADVVVVGDGPAGTAAASTLANHGIETIILGHQHRYQVTVGENAAASTPALVKEIFGQAGWRESDHLPCYGARVRWNGRRYDIDYLMRPEGHSWLLDRAAFDEHLRQVTVSSGVLHVPEKLQTIQRQGEIWTINTKERELSCRFVIDATGRSASTAQRLGVRRHHRDYQIAMWLTTPVSRHDTDQRITLESANNGWWYSAFLPNRGERMFIFYCDPRHMKRELAVFRAELAKTELISHLVDDCRWTATTLRTANARTSWAESVVGDGFALAGDAALSVDPLSGQGIVAALLTGRSAGELAAEIIGTGVADKSDHRMVCRTIFDHFEAERRALAR